MKSLAVVSGQYGLDMLRDAEGTRPGVVQGCMDGVLWCGVVWRGVGIRLGIFGSEFVSWGFPSKPFFNTLTTSTGGGSIRTSRALHSAYSPFDKLMKGRIQGV